jgi:hypothetical protein
MTAQLPQSSDDHARHDRWLVVRFASHDQLDAAESAAVRSQLGTCAACVALVDDIATIARATAMSRTPARPRDFRLTPEQAAARPESFLRRLFAQLASPRGAFVRPLAGAALAIGLVLVVASTSLPGMGTSAPAGHDQLTGRGAGAASEAAGVPPHAAASPRGPVLGDGPQFNAQDAQSLTPDSGVRTVALSPRTEMVLQSSAVPGPVATSGEVATSKATTADNLTFSASSAQATGGDGIGPAILVIGALLAVAGAIGLVLSWMARRATGEPLLR